MKKIALTMAMFAGLLASCSIDEPAVLDENYVEVQSIQSLQSCTEAAALEGTAVLSSYNGPQVTFNWNNSIASSAGINYVSYIEIAEDPSCPPPAGAVPVAASYPIDVFNTSSIVIPGVSSKCFYWRIVINGYVDSVLSCTASTDWMDATYVQ